MSAFEMNDLQSLEKILKISCQTESFLQKFKLILLLPTDPKLFLGSAF